MAQDQILVDVRPSQPAEPLLLALAHMAPPSPGSSTGTHSPLTSFCLSNLRSTRMTSDSPGSSTGTHSPITSFWLNNNSNCSACARAIEYQPKCSRAVFRMAIACSAVIRTVRGGEFSNRSFPTASNSRPHSRSSRRVAPNRKARAADQQSIAPWRSCLPIPRHCTRPSSFGSERCEADDCRTLHSSEPTIVHASLVLDTAISGNSNRGLSDSIRLVASVFGSSGPFPALPIPEIRDQNQSNYYRRADNTDDTFRANTRAKKSYLNSLGLNHDHLRYPSQNRPPRPSTRIGTSDAAQHNETHRRMHSALKSMG